MKNKTMHQWTRELASREGKYGGGSAASVVGAFATNLAQYVFELQQGKKKYADDAATIEEAIQRAKRISEELLDLAEVDADVFAPVMPLFRLPQNTEEERAYRQEKIDRGLVDATRPPLDILLKMDEVIDLFELLLKLEVKGSIVDDIAVGLIFTEAVVESEKINCDVNTKSIKEETLRTQMVAEVDDAYHRILERCRTLKTTTFQIIQH